MVKNCIKRFNLAIFAGGAPCFKYVDFSHIGEGNTDLNQPIREFSKLIRSLFEPFFLWEYYLEERFCQCGSMVQNFITRVTQTIPKAISKSKSIMIQIVS